MVHTDPTCGPIKTFSWCCSHGLFSYAELPFGLRSAVEKLMDLQNCCCGYFFSQFVHCLHWQGLYPAHAFGSPPLWKILWIFNVCIGKAFIQCMHWFSTKSFYRRVHIQKAFLQCGKAYESSRRWFWFNICHKFFNVCAIRALTQQMLSWAFKLFSL